MKNMFSPYKSDPFRSLHLAATDTHAIGILSTEKMMEFDKSCLKRGRILTARKKKILLTLTLISLVLETVKIVRLSREPTRG